MRAALGLLLQLLGLVTLLFLSWQLCVFLSLLATDVDVKRGATFALGDAGVSGLPRTLVGYYQLGPEAGRVRVYTPAMYRDKLKKEDNKTSDGRRKFKILCWITTYHKKISVRLSDSLCHG